MTNHLMLAFSEPAEGKTVEFNRWYDEVHVPQVLATPGFVAVTRYCVEQHPDMSRSRFRYLAIYEIETEDLAGVQRALGRRAAGFTPFAGLAKPPVTWFYGPLAGPVT